MEDSTLSKQKNRAKQVDIEEAKLRNSNAFAPAIDVCYVLDCTSSMGPYIANAKQTIYDVNQRVKSRYPTATINFSCIAYRDFGDKKQYEQYQLSPDLNAFKTFIGGLRAEGGGDSCEDVAGGLHHCVNWIQWKNPVRLCILIADCPCHGSQFHDLDDNHPKGDPNGRDPLTLVRSLREKKINFFFLKITDSTNKMIKCFQDVYEEGANYDSWKLVTLPLNNANVDEFLKAVTYAVSTSISMTATRSGAPSTELLGERLTMKAKKFSSGCVGSGLDQICKTPPDNSVWNQVARQKTCCFTNAEIYTMEKQNTIAGHCNINIYPEPFAKGGMRSAFWGMISGVTPASLSSFHPVANNLPSNGLIVVKESLYSGNTYNGKPALIRDLETQTVARNASTIWNSSMALKLQEYFLSNVKAISHQFKNHEKFNQLLRPPSASVVPSEIYFSGKIEYLPASVLYIAGRGQDREYVMVEPKLEGEFRKFNNNKGWVDDSIDCAILQAFSHWTYQFSHGEFLLSDVQGAIVPDYESNGKIHYKYVLTDPQVQHPDTSQFGQGNLGTKGMAAFFALHKCNEICERLHLVRPSDMPNFISKRQKSMSSSSPSTVISSTVKKTNGPTQTSTSSMIPSSMIGGPLLAIPEARVVPLTAPRTTPPVWMEDSRAFFCCVETCKKPFTFFNRRHHCRRCGEVICSDCSKSSFPLPWTNGKSERVCKECVNEMNGVV